MRILTLAFILFLLPPAFGQVGKSRGQIARPPEGAVEGFQGALRYSGLSDFADNRSPRAYTHALFGSVGYQFNERWNLETSLGLRAETIAGQIPKGHEQTYDEALNPSSSFALTFEDKLNYGNSYQLYLSAEPLWDEASRLEGYKGIAGLGGKWTSEFFRRRYVMTHDLEAAELVNTYAYGSDLKANPDYFFTYKFANVFRLFGNTRFAYTFGAKVTRYMDDFVGYSYSNSFSLSQKFGRATAALVYDNGGFTDDGEISLWYIDQYRRLARLVVSYTF